MRSRWIDIGAALLLVALFLGAGMLNARAWLMGSPASMLHLTATLVALAAWPIHGVWVGLRHTQTARHWRFPVMFWSTVVIFTVGGWLLLTGGSDSITDGPFSLLGAVAMYLATAPFYGLAYLVEINEWIFTIVGVSAIVLAVSLLAAFLSRHAVSRQSRSAPL